VFDPTQYCPLLQKLFQTVEIDLRDDTGYIVPFERGRVVVTLHCRKRKEILGSTKGQYMYMEFNPFLRSATQSETYSLPPREYSLSESKHGL
jgi:hypothetical protein